ncbi:cell envelope integrity protein CreD [Pseudoroseicyclus sp. CXY001]|uniref:cell envelope integrity protein CreD n=1 Tax=Pseudoroseicyclus sp. CXY001 TaxID=3242492 RepID=UPI00358DD4B0
MLRSAGWRFLIVGLLALFMVIPLFLVGAVIGDRADYAREAIDEVGAEWGGAQVLAGPQLVIPVEGEVTRLVDTASGVSTSGLLPPPREVTERARVEPLYIFPDSFELAVETVSEERHRGIFTVPVYSAVAVGQASFDMDEAESMLREGERLIWDEAELRIGLSSNRALRGETELTAGGAPLVLEPLPGNGILARVGDPRELGTVAMRIGFNGAGALHVAPVGRVSHVTLSSDWPHPSFGGAFLPDAQEVREDGFDAEWTIPHLARALPQMSRSDYLPGSSYEAMGLEFYQPNDFYQKAYRAARYGVLFVALTFLTVLLVEGRSGRPAHPVQYILIGLAQSVFVLLMVAYAEQIGYGPAYLLSSVATIGLLTFFGYAGLGLGRRTWVLSATLIVLYTLLYLILRSADYALIAGSTLAFAALAGTMVATRNEDWYGAEGARRRWFAPKPAEPEAAPPAPTPEAPPEGRP